MKKLIVCVTVLAASIAPLPGGSAAGAKSQIFYLDCDLPVGVPPISRFFLDVDDVPNDALSDCPQTPWSTVDPEEGSVSVTWELREEQDLVVDARRPVTGQLATRGYAPESVLSLSVYGIVGRKAKKLGVTRINGVDGPTATVDFEIKLPRGLHGKTVSGLTLVTQLIGKAQSLQFEVESPPSTLTIPTL